ncbi:hypothetical protein C8Q79DRAFT_351441 [Trametes meyenii]|nr:hypothetical protein C8Q79DRAFT_351441 [Trametes meyenii]
MAHDMSKPLPPQSCSRVRLAQKCELAILAHRLVMKLYLPFLKEAATTNRPCHQAVFGTVTAAHNIVHASRLLHSVWGQTRPAVFDFYDFGRTLFDAAVVCAHAVIQEPMSIIATEGMKSITCALDILKELGASRPGVEGTRADKHDVGSRREAIRIIETMKRKAEAARSGGSGAATSAGTKRKHAEVEPEPLVASSSFQLPFVGVSVSSSKPDRPRAPAISTSVSVSSSRPAGAPPRDAATHSDGKPKPDAKKQAKEKEKSREKGGPKAYEGPLRVRPMTGQPTPRRPRTSSVSTTAGATPTPSAPPAPPARSVPPPPAPLTPSVQTSLPPASTSHTQPTSSRASISIPESPSVSTPYEGYPTSAPATASSAAPDPVPQQEDYSMQYSSSDDMVDDRRYSAHSSYDSPPSATMYEPQPPPRYAQQSPAAYPPTPSQQGYYLYPPSAPSSAYDSSPMAPMPMGAVSGGQPIDSSGPGSGSIAPAMTTIMHEQQQQQHQPQQQHYMQDGSHHAPYAHHPHPHPHMAEHARPVAPHEYRPPPSSHGHPHTPMSVPPHVQGWPQQADPGAPQGPDMWPEYKFYGGMS